MITSTYDPDTEPLFTPESGYGPAAAENSVCSVCIITFSKQIFDHAMGLLPFEEKAAVKSVGGKLPVMTADCGGVTVGLFLSPITAAHAGGCLAEAAWITGCRKFILFGSCGTLAPEKTTGRFIIPTEAYRDEGLSYHYAPASDYIAVPAAQKEAALFEEMGIPHICGRIWTTDAFYRETRGTVSKRRDDGCIAVDMEVSGLQALCTHEGYELYPFLASGDVLDPGARYARGALDEANHSVDKLLIALDLAKRI